MSMLIPNLINFTYSASRLRVGFCPNYHYNYYASFSSWVVSGISYVASQKNKGDRKKVVAKYVASIEKGHIIALFSCNIVACPLVVPFLKLSMMLQTLV